VTQSEYWAECLAQSCEEHGVNLTPEQCQLIAEDLKTSHENYGMAFYQPTENPLQAELKETKSLLEKERSKTVCKTCWGNGRIISHGPHHSSDTQCHICHGEGKVAG
jgi:DnaJ-class molecular chaperone